MEISDLRVVAIGALSLVGHIACIAAAANIPSNTFEFVASDNLVATHVICIINSQSEFALI